MAGHLPCGFLGLRDNRQAVSVIHPKPDGPPELGQLYPDCVDSRVRILHCWADYGGSPRQAHQARVHIALPTRQQTILSYGLPEADRQVLNGGLYPLRNAARQDLTANIRLNRDLNG